MAENERGRGQESERSWADDLLRSLDPKEILKPLEREHDLSDLPWWVSRLVEDRELARRFLRWWSAAMELAYRRGDTRWFFHIHPIAVAWCDIQPWIRIDPSFLVDLEHDIAYFRHELRTSQGNELRKAAVRAKWRPVLTRKMKAQRRTARRLSLALDSVTEKPTEPSPLSSSDSTASRIKRVVDAHPEGITGKEIAAELGIEWGTVRKHFEENGPLKQAGYYNDHGYRPPKR